MFSLFLPSVVLWPSSCPSGDYSYCVSHGSSSICHAGKCGAWGTRFILDSFVLLVCRHWTGFLQSHYLVSWFSSNLYINLFFFIELAQYFFSVFDQVYCTSWVITFFFHLTCFYWMFLEGNLFIILSKWCLTRWEWIFTFKLLASTITNWVLNLPFLHRVIPIPASAVPPLSCLHKVQTLHHVWMW